MNFMTDKWLEERDKKLKYWLDGNLEAIRFILDIGEVSELVDNIHDGEGEKEWVQDVLWTCLVTIPNNPFYRQNYFRLQPLITHGILYWQLSNRYEEGKERLEYCFCYRDYYLAILNECIAIVRGYEFLRYHMHEVDKFFQPESFEDYAKEKK